MPSRILAVLRKPKRIATSLPELRYLVFEGMKGETGDSAYDVAVQLGFEGTEEEWLASLKGDTGANGRDGQDGAPGTPGADGEDGVSPTVQTAAITGGHRVTITDKAHPQGQSFDVMNGANGTAPAYLDRTAGVVRLVKGDAVYTSEMMQSDIDDGVLPLITAYGESGEEFFELDTRLVSASPTVGFRSKDHLLEVDDTGHFTLTDRPQGGGNPNAVLYTPQSLSDAQKAQARTNVGAGTYSKPASGIPASDLAAGVKESLNKADTALQTAPVTSVNGQTGDVVIEASEGTVTADTDYPSIADITELWNSVSKRPAGAWEDFAWHQCPEAVRNYIANVDYTGVAYTDSSIGTYAPTPAVPATNTKPIGQTVDGVTFYNIRPNSNAPYATANKSGVLNPLDQVRWIKSATSNMRDLGGWACDGGTVKYGLLYRSGELSAQDENLFIKELGINTECDLTADGTPAFPGKMRFIGYTSYAMYTLANTGAWQTNLRGIFDAVKYGEPVVFHCTMGADRTGTLACILEGLLGVSQSDIDKDYELTSFYAERARNGNYQGGTTDWAHLIAQILALEGDTFRDKCVTFVRGLGFTVAEINEYRHAMIDGDPEDISAPATTYTVTNTLTGCTTNNPSSSADGGGVYAATITADSGYTLTGATVQITMGGTDITASAYSNGTISIANVTGNIVIAITAAAESSLKELFDPSAATINQRFSSSGAYTAQNGNFCTDFIPVNGLNSSEPWRIHIKDATDATRFRTAAVQESILFCKADKSIINANYGRLTVSTNASATNTLCKHNDSNGGVYIDINQTGNGNYIPSSFFDLSQVAYIRVCMAYSSGTAIPDTATLANISITADKITN